MNTIYDCVKCEMKFELPEYVEPYQHPWGTLCFDCEEKLELDVEELPTQ